jgi:lipopolysaccharide transport system ATP-binding protein
VNANYRDTLAMKPEDRGFHLFRDPRDALISGYWSWRNSHQNNKDTLLEMRETLQAASLEDGLILMLDHLIMSVQMEGWKVNSYDNILEVRYEDLVANPTKKFREITSFLKIDVTDEEISDTMDLTSFERMSKGRKPGEEDTKSHFRKGVPGDWKNVFTDKVKDAFKERYGDHLIDLGYEDGTGW